MPSPASPLIRTVSLSVSCLKQIRERQWDQGPLQSPRSHKDSLGSALSQLRRAAHLELRPCRLTEATASHAGLARSPRLTQAPPTCPLPANSCSLKILRGKF